MIMHVVGEKFEELVWGPEWANNHNLFLGQYETRQLTPPELCLMFRYFEAFFLSKGGNLLLQSQRLHGIFGHSYLDPTEGWVSDLDSIVCFSP